MNNNFVIYIYEKAEGKHVLKFDKNTTNRNLFVNTN